MDPVTKILEWRNSPLKFVSDVWPNIELQPHQEKILRLIETERHLTVRAGRGPGKTASLAWVILHHICTRYPWKVPCTSGVQAQLKDTLMAEICLWASRLPQPIKQSLEIATSRIYLKRDPDNCFVVPRTARIGGEEALRGFHSPNLLIIADEASAVPRAVLEPLSGALASPGSKIILSGNPSLNSGYFYDSFHKHKSHWCQVHISCEDAPRVPREFIKQMEDKHGRDSNIFRVEVLGEFPKADDDALVSLEDLEASQKRHVAQAGPIMWALDVATFGSDSCVLVKRHGNYMWETPISWAKAGPSESAGRVINEYKNTPVGYRPVMINVDFLPEGAGIVERLQEAGLPARTVNTAEVAHLDPARYANLRVELWHLAAEWFACNQNATKGADLDILFEDLLAAQRRILPSGKLQVTSREDFIKQIGRSPDHGSAFALTFFRVPTPVKRRTKGLKSSPSKGVF